MNNLHAEQASSTMAFCSSMRAKYHELMRTGDAAKEGITRKMRDEVNADVEEAKKLVRQGYSLIEIGKMQGVADTTVGDRFRRRGISLASLKKEGKVKS